MKIKQLTREQLLLLRINELLLRLAAPPANANTQHHLHLSHALTQFRARLQQGRLSLPLPVEMAQPIDHVISAGVFDKPDYNELYLRLCDVRDLLFSRHFPLLSWRTMPAEMDGAAREQIWQLYCRSVTALATGDLPSYLQLVGHALADNDASLNCPPGRSLQREGRRLQHRMTHPDFSVTSIARESLVLTPVFHPGTVRITDAHNSHAIQMSFTESDGQHYSCAVCLMVGHFGVGQWQIVFAVP